MSSNLTPSAIQKNSNPSGIAFFLPVEGNELRRGGDEQSIEDAEPFAASEVECARGARNEPLPPNDERS